MELVGQILKKNRKIKKLSILDISNELNISKEILDDIENDHFQNNIDYVFILGHLRSYCSFLGLNQDELIDQFKKQHQPNKNIKINIRKPKVINNLLYSNKIFSFSLIIMIFTTFYFLFVEVDKTSKEYALIPDLPENYIAIIEKASVEGLVKSNNTKKVNEENFAELESNIGSSSAIASLPKNNTVKSSTITLKILDDTWLQLRNRNNEIVFSQLMNKDDEYSYPLDNKFSITSGNAGHILVIINQTVRGKIGKKGQVVDSLVLSKDFSN
ncbi:MAG: DUF4115 domain-containing protein [Pelagibacteraceae bacterium]|nr:DUF4115 domain-containing protein [Pelagibacteraceae bacterium]